MNKHIHNTILSLSVTSLFMMVLALATPAAATDITVTQTAPEAVLDQVELPSLNEFSRNIIRHDHATARPREDVDWKSVASAKPVDPQAEITGRFSDSKMTGFLQRTSLSQLSTLYLEISRMVDSRHVSPISYEERSRAAILGLVQAVQNETFLRASGANARNDMVQTVQRELQQLAQSQPARTANEALGLMQWSAELVNQRLGARKEAVALEFVNATIDSLDRFSSFMPSDGSGAPGASLNTIKTAGLEENIVGIGVEMKAHDRGALVVGVVENGPAQELGLQDGDIIIGINQRSVAGQNLNQIADQISGPAGSSFSIDIDRNGQKYRGTLTRRSVYVSSVSGTKMIDSQNKVGYVKLKHFSESSTKDLEAAMFTLHRQGMQSLILDLRGNPGGLLDQAITVSDLFLPSGTIVSTKGRNASDNTMESAKYDKTWAVPLVVLVDDNSASASEIFAAAMQENGRGVIVGRDSYGKGTVQTHFPLQTVSGHLKLTTAKFYSPNGREMAGAGVTPDVMVALNDTTTNYRATLESDKDLQTALQVIQSGSPSQMATLSSQGKKMLYQATSNRPQYNERPQFNERPQYNQPTATTPFDNFGSTQRPVGTFY